MKKTLGLIILAIFATISFTSCFSPIYYEVMNDVYPEKATVSGNINSICRYTVGNNRDNEYLVLAADYGVRYKLASNQVHGSWCTFDVRTVIPDFAYHTYDYTTSTHNGYQIAKVLTDTDYLYLFCASYTNSDYGTTTVSNFYLWALKPSVNSDGSWSTTDCEVKVVSIPDNTFPTFYYSEVQYTAFSIFSTNAPQRANRRIYIRSGALNTVYPTITYYQLSNGQITSAGNLTPVDSTDTNQISSVVMFNGSPVFFNSIASTTNETYTSPATRIYYGSGKCLYYSDTNGSNFTKSSLDAGNPITTLTTTADTLLIGCGYIPSVSTSTTSTGGLVRTTLADGVPGSSLIDFTSNASFKLTSSNNILATLNATPEKTEAESSLYASINFYGTGSSSSSVSYTDVGLWSYYPSRGNWHRE